jgi:hypothetical protein
VSSGSRGTLSRTIRTHPDSAAAGPDEGDPPLAHEHFAGPRAGSDIPGKVTNPCRKRGGYIKCSSVKTSLFVPMKTKTPPKKKPSGRRWSAKVTKTSNAMDLEKSVFLQRDPTRIARSLKRSAEQSHRRKAPPFQSAMSMLNFYINRAGTNLSDTQARRLERAKDELRRLYHRA